MWCGAMLYYVGVVIIFEQSGESGWWSRWIIACPVIIITRVIVSKCGQKESKIYHDYAIGVNKFFSTAPLNNSYAFNFYIELSLTKNFSPITFFTVFTNSLSLST